MINLVVCETEVAVVLHVRRGVYQHCGKQDSMTLCGSKPAWDMKIPLQSLIRDKAGVCRICRDKLIAEQE